MKSPRIDIPTIRKEQIVEAAVAVIAEQGLHHLSLSEIETKAGMSRGQLTYYFESKEDILLAVFDRVLQLMYQRLGQPPGAEGCAEGSLSGWNVASYLLKALLTKPPISPEFHCLQYTFLAQISYREDFRQRLARLYEEWRTKMSQGLAADLAKHPGTRKVPPRAMATLIQAILHGLTLQAAADPKAFDAHEMLQLCLDMLGSYLGASEPDTAPRRARATTKSRTAAGAAKAKAANGATLASKR
jgi:AcrR family transcriptional regulator